MCGRRWPLGRARAAAGGHRFENRLNFLAVSASLAQRTVLLIVLFAANLSPGFVSPPGTCRYESEPRLEAVYAGSRLGVRVEMTYGMDSRPPQGDFRCPDQASERLAAPGRAHPRLRRLEKECNRRKDMRRSLAVSEAPSSPVAGRSAQMTKPRVHRILRTPADCAVTMPRSPNEASRPCGPGSRASQGRCRRESSGRSSPGACR